MRTLIPLMLLIPLAGCGQTGALYMPGEAPSAQVPGEETPSLETLEAENTEALDVENVGAPETTDQQD
ncbi:LPS translocon maturation chaperone LptM [Haliea sp. E17]|uniref:LPS translocon maturation chaperone LptM n=1 Tax=Haliea sp. E17 TaxID=3401576 RepID=UPI003AACE961